MLIIGRKLLLSIFVFLISLYSIAHDQCLNLFTDRVQKHSSSNTTLSGQRASVTLYNGTQPIGN